MSFMLFLFWYMEVNKFTTPGFVGAVFGAFNIVFTAIYIKELKSCANKDSSTINMDMEKPTPTELKAMIISIFLYFVVIAIFSIFETMITVITKDDFGWTTQENGYLFMVVGVISVVVFAGISIPAMKKKDDRMMLIVGNTLQIIGLFTAVTWTLPNLQKQLTKEQFFTAVALIGIGYPISSAYMFTIYSKVLNPVYQGTKMGYLTAGGSLARMLGPLWAVTAYKYGGGELLFVGTNFLVIFSLVVLFIYYNLLAPHPAYYTTIITPTVTSGPLPTSSYSQHSLSSYGSAVLLVNT